MPPRPLHEIDIGLDIASRICIFLDAHPGSTYEVWRAALGLSGDSGKRYRERLIELGWITTSDQAIARSRPARSEGYENTPIGAQLAREYPALVAKFCAQRPLTAAPSLVNVEISCQADRPPVLEWRPVPGAQRYDVELALTARMLCAVTSGSTHQTWWAPNQLIPPGRYFWSVRAVNDEGPGPWSEPGTVHVQ